MKNNYLTKTLLTFLCGFLTVSLVAQNLIIKPVTIPDPNNIGGRVKCIFQDKIGYIWIGKESGLYRYDGKEFKTFRYSSSDTSTISSNIVSAIAEDRLGDLWIGTIGGGLNHYHRKTGKFTRYMHQPNNLNSISFNEILTIFPDGKGNLWIGTDGGGLNFFDPKSGKFQCYLAGKTPAKDLRSNKILHSALAANNKYWLATWGGGLHLFDPISKETKHFGDGTRYENCRIHFIKEVSPGILWLGTNDQGLIAYDIRRDKFSTIVPPNIVSYFWDIEVTAKGEVYAVSFDGLFYFQSTESAYRVVESVNLDFTNIYDIFIDRNQTFWAGNISGLVGTINSYKNKFHTFQPSSPFSELPIYSIVTEESSDQLYFSSRNLFVKYNYITKQYQSTNIQPDTWLMLAEIRGENSLLCASRSSFSIYEKINGRITTLKFDKKSSEYFQKHNALIRTIYSTNSGKFWIGAESTGYQIGVKAQSKLWKIKKVICAGKNSDISECHFPSCFLNHPNGDFWIGTWGGGVNRLRAGEQQFVPMMNDLSNKNSISDNYIQCMTVDHDGDLLIGTRTGLNRFDFRSSTFSSLLISDGLDDDMIFAIAVDAKNRAWVSTRRGISLVYDDFKTIKNYIVNDGFSSNEFLPRSVATDRVGNIYFGLKRGLVWFHPDSIYDDPFIPKPVIVVLK